MKSFVLFFRILVFTMCLSYSLPPNFPSAKLLSHDWAVIQVNSG